MAELILKDEVYAIVGAAIEVYNQLGSGFLESVYQEALEVEFTARGIPFRSQIPIRVRYKGRELRRPFIADFVCYGSVIVELKAIRQTTDVDEAQVLNYLRATDFRLGLLINFGDPGRLDWTRVIN